MAKGEALKRMNISKTVTVAGHTFFAGSPEVPVKLAPRIEALHKQHGRVRRQVDDEPNLALTSKDKKIRSHVRVEPPEAGLKVTSFVKCEDIRSVASERLSRRWGRVSAPTMRAVGETVRILLEL